jgi:hypothetical protein
VEALAIWVAAALAATLTTGALLATGLPDELSDAFGRALGGGGAPRAAGPDLVERALRPGGPSLLLVLAADGSSEAAPAVDRRSAIEDRVAADPRIAGPLDVTALLPPRHAGYRLVAYPIGSPRLVSIAGDEPLPMPVGITVSPGSLVGGAIAGGELASGTRRALERFGKGAGSAFRVAGHAWDVVGIVQDAAMTDAGLDPGSRAGDATLCRPVELRASRAGSPTVQWTRHAHEVIVLRSGAIVARYVPPGTDGCPT